jgi:hypothetical protein
MCTGTGESGLLESVRYAKPSVIKHFSLYIGLLALNQLSHAAEPVSLECQALVSVWRSDNREQARIENFNLIVDKHPRELAVEVTGDTSIRLKTTAVDQITRVIELTKTELHVDSLNKQGGTAELQTLRVDTASGGLMFNSLVKPDTEVIARGKCKTPWLIVAPSEPATEAQEQSQPVKN